MKIILYIILSIGLLSCSPKQRFNRLVKNHPWLLTTDTLIIKDTIRDTIRITIPEVRVDTVVKVDQLYDTVTITKDRLKVKVWRVNDKVYINGKCDTVFIEKPYEKIIERQIPVKYYEKDNQMWLYRVLGILFIFLVIYIIYSSKNEN
jgi:hypothetical protein